jgi:uncharacterized membrane protein
MSVGDAVIAVKTESGSVKLNQCANTAASFQ